MSKDGLELQRNMNLCIRTQGRRSNMWFMEEHQNIKRNHVKPCFRASEDQAFTEGGLKKLLESDRILKVFYDLRADNDALHHLHEVHVLACYDLQVLRQLKFQDSTDFYLPGLKKVLSEFLKESKIMTEEQMKEVDAVKEQGQDLFAPEKGGTKIWRERPLRPLLLDYAALDVQFLLEMKRFWTPKEEAAAEELRQEVMRASLQRLWQFVSLPREVALD